MRIAEIIARVKITKPNAFTDDILTSYINALEQQVQGEVLRTPIAERVDYTWETNSDTELLIPVPYDSCYLFYVSAMIDYNNQEFESYNQNMSHFNSLYDDYKKWYVRNEPSSNTRIKNIW